VLITAAAGGVGSAAVQIAAAIGARPLGVASPPNRDYLESLGASEVFDYHAVGWAQQVRAAVPGGTDLLLDGAGGQARDQALGAVRDGAPAIFLVLQSTPAQLERGITDESFAAHVDRPRLEQLGPPGRCRPAAAQVGAVLPLEQVREALARVAAGTRAADRAADRAIGAAAPRACAAVRSGRRRHRPVMITTLSPSAPSGRLCLPAIVKPWRPHARPPSPPAAACRYSQPRRAASSASRTG
jgi:NADPH:quinone reductase-like Zn-dependent oxidoreductase